MDSVKNIILFASGSGSNVENIAGAFRSEPRIRIRAVFGNNLKAGVIERCARLGLPFYGFSRDAFRDTEGFTAVLGALDPDLIVLAGFLWKIPEGVVQAFEGRILNIHPALLPAYGGKGMYGMNVHRAVVANREGRSGITVHYVNAEYDEGAVILQRGVTVLPSDTPEAVAAKVHDLEYRYFPVAIRSVLFPEDGR